MERSLSSRDNVYKFVDDSSEKSWPDPEKIPGGNEVPFSLKNIPIVGPSLSSCISQGTKAIKSIQDNPEAGSLSIGDDELREFEEFAKLKCIGAIGYTKLPPHLIFKDYIIPLLS